MVNILEGMGIYFVLLSAILSALFIKGSFYIRPAWRKNQIKKTALILFWVSIVTGLYTWIIILEAKYTAPEIILAILIIWFSSVVFYFMFSRKFFVAVKDFVPKLWTNFFNKQNN